MLTLFDAIERTDTKPAGYAEPTFPYLNRSASQDFDKVRRELESWFTRYPQACAVDLLRRFRSKNEDQHSGAFFELFLHEMLLRMGAMLEVNPEVPGSSKRPEFRVSAHSVQFYVEAKVAKGESKAQTSARKRANLVYDLLDDLDSPDYWINVEVKGTPNSPVPTSKLKRFLSQRIAELNYDEVAGLFESTGRAAMPRWPYEFEGWSVEFFPIPKESARGQPGVRVVGQQMQPPTQIDPATPLRESILEKAKRYGNPDLPYVIAVNACDPFISDRYFINALFGDEVFVSRFEDEAVQLERTPNGVWTSSSGRYTRVSACLIFQKLHALNFPSAEVRLFHHPLATRRVEGPLLVLPQANVVNSHIKYQGGSSLSQVFGIRPDWLGNRDDD